MQVHVIGPNLPDQSKGSFHVHAKGCADVRRNQDYSAPDFEFDRRHTYDVNSHLELSREVFADQIAEESMTEADGLHDMHFFPCVDSLPVAVEIVESDGVPAGAPRFYMMDLEEDQQGADLYPETYGVVDEQQGGIIAYAAEDNARTIVDALQKAAASKDSGS